MLLMQIVHQPTFTGIGQRCFAAKPAAVKWTDILLPALVPAAKRGALGRCNARRGRGGTRVDETGGPRPVQAASL